MKKILLLATLLLFSPHLLAHDAPSINYQVTETKTVESDLLVVKVNIQHNAKDAGAASRRVNGVAVKIIEMTQAIDGVTITSGGYRTWSQQYGKKSMGRVEWIVQQTLTMETQKFDQLLGNLGEIQQVGGAIQSLNYTVSPQRKREIQQQLRVKAISSFRERASEYAVAAGRENDQWELLTVNVGGKSPQPVMPMTRGMLAMESAQGVTAPAGMNTLSTTVSGTILLKEPSINIEEKIQTLTEKVVKQLQ